MTDEPPKLTPTQWARKQAEMSHQERMAALSRAPVAPAERVEVGRDGKGYKYEVGGVAGETETLAEVAKRVLAVSAELEQRLTFTAPSPDVELTRNAKHETQIKVSGDAATAPDKFSELRARFLTPEGTAGNGPEVTE